MLLGHMGTMIDLANHQRSHQAAQQMAAMQNMANRPLYTTMSPPPGHISNTQLNQLQELLPDEKQFIARNLVRQAQSDYAAAVARGDRYAEMEAAARVGVEEAKQAQLAIARDLADTRGKLSAAEAALRALRPQVLKRLIPDSGPGSHELKWPWLAASWALVIAGLAVVIL